MIEAISLLMAIGVGAYVIVPLVKKQAAANVREAAVDGRMSELLHRQTMANQTIDDLEFDFQTGKLSEEDYRSLVEDQQKINRDADARLKDISGVSVTELIERLEKEIAQEKSKLKPGAAVVCPTCKKPTKKEDKFCSECGAKLF